MLREVLKKVCKVLMAFDMKSGVSHAINVFSKMFFLKNI